MVTPAILDRARQIRIGSVNSSAMNVDAAIAISSQTSVEIVDSSVPLLEARSTSLPALLIFTGIRVLQLNMRRSAVATGEDLHVRKQGSGYAFIGLGTEMRVAAVCAQLLWAAVVACNPEFQIMLISQINTTHCACAELRAPGFSFYVASCCFQFSDEIEGHLRNLEKVLRSLRGQRVLVGMDANAQSLLRGDRKLDDIGAMLQDFIRACGYKVLNVVGQPFTYWTSWGLSHIDVTLLSPSMSYDHNSLDIRLRVQKVRDREQRTTKTRFDTNREDWEKFVESLVDLSVSRFKILGLTLAEDAVKFADAFAGSFMDACQKQESVEPIRSAKLRVYRSSLREYTREARKARLGTWRKFVTEQGNPKPWGLVYKHQANKLRVDKVLSILRGGKSSIATLEETAAHPLVVQLPDDRENEDTLQQREVRDSAHHVLDTANDPLFTGAEIAAAVRSLANNKAPSLDLIKVSVLKAAYKAVAGQFIRLFNGCLQCGVFFSI
ncbi:PREDICTED: uncharacterized protein LOC106743113 [Dinoponera quadriceps]|uniref:Uncharacterized protein LOC106743113 n=1 Tax=Dinoponera quadriceps TaxID=609295 RepID=A0A6P3X1C2_DINQU|nr:PREDICTED: uncharacterized protein LOC106743113 [Dinoponera quadriceps]